MKIRNFNTDDEEFLAKLFLLQDVQQQLFSPPQEEHKFKRWLYTENRYVVEDEGVKIAYAVILKSEIRGFFGYAIAENYRGLGKAKYIITLIENECRRLGIKTLTTNVAVDNIKSIKVLQKSGFRQFLLFEMNIVGK